jgi:hypothetical protein
MTQVREVAQVGASRQGADPERVSWRTFYVKLLESEE